MALLSWTSWLTFSASVMRDRRSSTRCRSGSAVSRNGGTDGAAAGGPAGSETATFAGVGARATKGAVIGVGAVRFTGVDVGVPIAGSDPVPGVVGLRGTAAFRAEADRAEYSGRGVEDAR